MEKCEKGWCENTNDGTCCHNCDMKNNCKKICAEFKNGCPKDNCIWLIKI